MSLYVTAEEPGTQSLARVTPRVETESRKGTESLTPVSACSAHLGSWGWAGPAPSLVVSLEGSPPP